MNTWIKNKYKKNILSILFKGEKVIVNLGTLKDIEGDYIIIDAYEAPMLDFLVNEEPEKVRAFIRNLTGVAKILYNKKVKVKKVTKKEFPEYYI